MYTYTIQTSAVPFDIGTVVLPAEPKAEAEPKKAEAPAEEQKRSFKQSFVIFRHTGRKDEADELTKAKASELIALFAERDRRHGGRCYKADEALRRACKGLKYLEDWLAKGGWVCPTAADREKLEGPLPKEAEPKKTPSPKAPKSALTALKRAAKAMIDSLDDEAKVREVLSLLK